MRYFVSVGKGFVHPGQTVQVVVAVVVDPRVRIIRQRALAGFRALSYVLG